VIKYTFNLIIVSLIALGLFIAWQRHQHTQIPFVSDEKKSVWLIEAKLEFDADKNKPVLASLSIPNQIPGYKRFFEQSASAGYGFNIVEADAQRRAQWSIRKAEFKQTLYYKVQVTEDKSSQDTQDAEVPSSGKDLIWTQVEELALQELLDKALSRSSDDVTLTRELIKLLSSESMKESTSLLLSNKKRVNVINSILHEAGVKSRIAMGLKLEDARRNQTLSPMIEVYSGKKWMLFNPVTAKENTKEELFLWHRGGALIEINGGSNANVTFSMVKQNIPALELAKTNFDDSAFGLFSVSSLPIEEQSIFKILLLLPMGALITVFMRLMIGIKTSGTFMPVLIAMAFLQTTLLPGLITFIMIVAVGLLIRSYLSHLNLLLVSRIATTIIIVIFIILISSIVGHSLGFNTGMTVAIFPIIILAWTIERMSILWEEDGVQEVLIQGGGSLFVASIAYLVMQSSIVGHLSFNFPEINLIVLALMMLMGRYTGYRLSEFYRFRDFKAL
jgi:hypothetical protein